MKQPGRIYTKAGDEGRSSTLDGVRRPKSHIRFRSLGSLDELNASLGAVAADPSLAAGLRGDILRLQRDLFEAGTALACNDPATSAGHFQEATGWLETRIDSMQAELPPLTRFILPGGSGPGAALHLSRTICRRAESAVVEYCAEEAGAAGHDDPPQKSEDEAEPMLCLAGRIPLLAWLNRLSDTLFVLARYVNMRAGVEEAVWESSAYTKQARGKES